MQQWCEQLPEAVLRGLADVALGRSAAAGLAGATSSPMLDALAKVQKAASSGNGPYLAGLLNGMRLAFADRPVVRAVWTGPRPEGATAARLTLAVVSDLLSEAQRELLLVSYAVYPGPEVVTALSEAASRGVRITLLLEHTDDAPQGFRGHVKPFAGIPAVRLRWQGSAREPGASLHAKLLVVDRRVALVGSANVTDSAMLKNLECGILIRDGELPSQLVDHVLRCSAFTTA